MGGFSARLGGRTIYPIQVAEKGCVWLKLRVRGNPGHGSLPRPDSTVGRLGQAVFRLATTRLPQHRTRVVDGYLRAVAATQKFPKSLLMRNLHNRSIADVVLKSLEPGLRAATGAILSNTAVPTVLRAGSKTNVIPGVAEAEIDGRTLPDQTAADLIREIKAVIEEPDAEIEILRDMPPVETTTESPLWELMTGAIRRADPEGTPVPYLCPGFTDAKSWSRLGTKSYGFMPVRFPDDGTRFADLFHGNDERIPVEGLQWGVNVLYDVVKKWITNDAK